MTWRRTLGIGPTILMTLLIVPAVTAAGADTQITPNPSLMLFTQLVWLLPLGIALLAAGVGEPSRAEKVAGALPIALVIALAGYSLTGFAFQFGGIGIINQAPGLETLTAEWSPLDIYLGEGWGLMGLRGFALPFSSPPPEVLGLFLTQLALVTTATLIPLVTLHGRIPRLPAFSLALFVAGVSYPIVGNWLRGGGWLSHLATTLHLGQGWVDRGLASLHLVGAGAALAGLVAFRKRGWVAPSRAELPPSHLPLSVLIGAFLALLGWLVGIASQPPAAQVLDLNLLLLNALVAIAGAVTACYGYCWLTRGRSDVALIHRSMLAALIAISAALDQVPPWAALVIGGVAGLLLAPMMYLVDHVLGLDDRAAVVSTHGFSALWGLLAAGLFGPTGLTWSASQMQAQLLGTAGILGMGLLIPFGLMAAIAQAYTLPVTLRVRARERALQLEQQRRALERLRLQGKLLNIWQRTSQATLAMLSASELRLARRARLTQKARTARQAITTRRRRLGPAR